MRHPHDDEKQRREIQEGVLEHERREEAKARFRATFKKMLMEKGKSEPVTDLICDYLLLLFDKLNELDANAIYELVMKFPLGELGEILGIGTMEEYVVAHQEPKVEKNAREK